MILCHATKPMVNEVALAEEMKMSIMYANVDEVTQFLSLL